MKYTLIAALIGRMYRTARPTAFAKPWIQGETS